MSTTEIPAGLVKQLREETGAGMMDCKRALQETGGDVEAAKRLLREREHARAQNGASHGNHEAHHAGSSGYDPDPKTGFVSVPTPS